MHPTLICPVDIAFYLKNNRNIVCNYWLLSFSYRSLFMSAFFFLNDSTMDKSWFPNCSFADATLETKSPTRKKKLHLFTMGVILIIMPLFIIRPSKKIKDVSRPDFYKKKRRAFFLFFLLFPIACFLYTLLPSPRDTLELLGQILITRNIRY